MKSFFAVLLIAACAVVIAHEPTTVQPVDRLALPELTSDTPTLTHTPIETGQRSFRRTLLRQARDAVRGGQITRVQMSQLRVATLSRNFRVVAQNLAVVELAFSATETDLPRNTNGVIEASSIDWEAVQWSIDDWIALIRTILELLREFGIIGGDA